MKNIPELFASKVLDSKTLKNMLPGDVYRNFMKTIHEIEQKRHCHQQNHYPQGSLYGFHFRISCLKQRAGDQEFSRTMPSMMLATFSHLSETDSSSS